MSMEEIAEETKREKFQDTCLSEATIVFCRDLAFDCGERELRELFLTVCTSGVRQTSVFRGRNDQPMGFGFVELWSEDDVDLAVTQLNGREFLGRNIGYILFNIFYCDCSD